MNVLYTSKEKLIKTCTKGQPLLRNDHDIDVVHTKTQKLLCERNTMAE